MQLTHLKAVRTDVAVSANLRSGEDDNELPDFGVGADVAGLALPFLQAADTSSAAVAELVQILMAEIQTVLFCTGNINLLALLQANCLQRLNF